MGNDGGWRGGEWLILVGNSWEGEESSGNWWGSEEL